MPDQFNFQALVGGFTRVLNVGSGTARTFQEYRNLHVLNVVLECCNVKLDAVVGKTGLHANFIRQHSLLVVAIAERRKIGRLAVKAPGLPALRYAPVDIDVIGKVPGRSEGPGGVIPGVVIFTRKRVRAAHGSIRSVKILLAILLGVTQAKRQCQLLQRLRRPVCLAKESDGFVVQAVAIDIGRRPEQAKEGDGVDYIGLFAEVVGTQYVVQGVRGTDQLKFLAGLFILDIPRGVEQIHIGAINIDIVVPVQLTIRGDGFQGHVAHEPPVSRIPVQGQGMTLCLRNLIQG